MDLIKKRKKNSIFCSKFFLIFILIFLFIFLKAIFSFYQKALESKNLREQTEKELLELQNRKKELEKKIEKIDSSTGIEEQLREKFNLIKEGEKAILINDEKDSTSSK